MGKRTRKNDKTKKKQTNEKTKKKSRNHAGENFQEITLVHDFIVAVVKKK